MLIGRPKADFYRQSESERNKQGTRPNKAVGFECCQLACMGRHLSPSKSAYMHLFTPSVASLRMSMLHISSGQTTGPKSDNRAMPHGAYPLQGIGCPGKELSFFIHLRDPHTHNLYQLQRCARCLLQSRLNCNLGPALSTRDPDLVQVSPSESKWVQANPSASK